MNPTRIWKPFKGCNQFQPIRRAALANDFPPTDSTASEIFDSLSSVFKVLCLRVGQVLNKIQDCWSKDFGSTSVEMLLASPQLEHLAVCEALQVLLCSIQLHGTSPQVKLRKETNPATGVLNNVNQHQSNQAYRGLKAKPHPSIQPQIQHAMTQTTSSMAAEKQCLSISWSAKPWGSSSERRTWRQLRVLGFL